MSMLMRGDLRPSRGLLPARATSSARGLVLRLQRWGTARRASPSFGWPGTTTFLVSARIRARWQLLCFSSWFHLSKMP